ncbi:MAG: PD-(D/E)XK nuclease family protein [Cetobacterium sp.]
MDKKKLEHQVYSKLRKEKTRLISFSEVTEFETCPHARYLHRIIRVDGKNNIYAVAGSLCHDLLERHYTEGLTKEEMIYGFENGMVEIFKEGYSFMTDKVGTSWLNNMRMYFQGFESDPSIKSCEDFVSLPLWIFDTELEDVYAQGWVDAVIENADGSVSLGDFKSSTIFRGNDLRSKSKQLVLYSVMYEHMYKRKVKSIFFDFLKYAEIEYRDVKGKVKKKIVERQELFLYDIISSKKAYVYIELDDVIKKDTLDWFLGLIHGMKNETEWKKGCGCTDFYSKYLCSYKESCSYVY